MRARRVGTSTLSLFAGVSLISSGAISAFLAGAHGTQYAHTVVATNICGQHTAVIRPGVTTARQAQLQLDSASVPHAVSPTTPVAGPSVSNPVSSTTPTVTSSSPSSPPPTTATPSPTKTTPKPTPSKTVTPPPPPPPVQLCLSVQALTTASAVQPGGTASYTIWVWPSGGAAKGITVTANAKISSAVALRFTVCPRASGATCTVGSLASGQMDELQAAVTVPATAKAGERVALTATAKATGAKSAAPASASALIAAKTGSRSTAPSPTLPISLGPSGVGATLPTGFGGLGASATLGVLPSATSDPGGLFPTVGPGATQTPSTGTLPNARGVRVTDVSQSFPLSTRLVGGQVLGLAVLAAALVIAVARLSLREPRPQSGKDRAP
jgi:hypothetical protein